MKILVFSQNWFCEEFRSLGHDVRSIGLKAHTDVNLAEPFIHIDEVIADYLNGWTPDIILIHDDSAPFYVEGFPECGIPTVFLSIDTHHHSSLHGNLGRIFDKVLVAQKDFIPEIQSISDSSVDWMPLWASDYVEPCETKEYGAVFIGTLEPYLNAERCDFFEKLQKEVEIVCQPGSWQTMFPQSEIVINQTVKKDVNFRVFEAMMSGALLLTERTENGLPELFEDGTHLITYEKGNVEEAVEKIRYFLKNKDEARRIGAAGREKILEMHLPIHRAKRLISIFETLQCEKSKPRSTVGWLHNYFGIVCRSNRTSRQLISRCLEKGLQSAERIVDKREPLDEVSACVFAFTCLLADMTLSDDSGETLLKKAISYYPEYPILSLALIRSCLNRGAVELARQFAAVLDPTNPDGLFPVSEQVVAELFSSQLDKFFVERSQQ